MAKREQMGTGFEPGTVERIAGAVRYLFTGKEPIWFGPLNPLPPLAPEDQKPSVAGRQFDFPVGYNQRIRPRDGEAVTFAEMRSLADGYDIMRLVIETRKDQMAKLRWTIRPKDPKAKIDDRCKAITEFFASPDREHTWDEWLRMLLEDLFVIDAPALYARPTIGGQLYALEPIDGATIKRVIDEHGRTPLPPLPAYQQILKGVPAINYTRDELIYKPRNPRTHKLYGFSPVEQVIMTVNIALRRQVNQLQYYTEGNVPEALASVPKEWNPDQIAQFQMYWDTLLEGDTAARRHLKFIPDGVNYKETKAPPLKDDYDEWLARVICFAFSIEPTPFVKQQNRATAQTAREQSLQEGLAPIMQWVNTLCDSIVVRYFKAPDLEFTWQEEESQSPLEAAQVSQIYLSGKVLTPDEVRQDLGRDPLTPEERAAAFPAPPMLATPEEDNPAKPGDEKTPEPPASEKVTKVKKKPAVTTIDRERPAIVKLRAKLDKVVAGFLKDKAKDIAAQVVAAKDQIGKSDADEVRRILEALNFDDWAVLVGDVADIVEKLTKEGAAAAIAQIGLEDDKSMVSLVNEQAVQWAEERAAEWVGKKRLDDGSLIDNPDAQWRIDESTREMLGSTVTQAMEEGWSNDRLADEIAAAHAFSPERAEMIARTETAFADVQGNLLAYKQSGQVQGKKWLTAADCCDECQELDGMEVGIDDDFPKDGGDGPPLHPNCRCDIVPILIDEPNNDSEG